MTEQDLVFRLRKRAEIRRQITTRKSVQEGKPDRIADLLEEAADEIQRLRAKELPLTEVERDAFRKTVDDDFLYTDVCLGLAETDTLTRVLIRRFVAVPGDRPTALMAMGLRLGKLTK